MALEAVVYQQDCHYFSNSSSTTINNNNGIDHLYPLLLESWQLDHDYLLGEINQLSSSEFGWDYNNNYYCDYNGSTNNTCSTNLWDYSPSTTTNDVVSPPSDHSLPTLNHDLEWAHNSSPSIDEQAQAGVHHHIHDYDGMEVVMTTTTRSKRRRARSKKNKEDIENQRMTHIAVERNRRKQMNDYLNVIRSLMPDSYVQRGDQASIIGGAINFVKELEQKMQCLSAKKQIKENHEKGDTNPSSLPFGEFFTFPQYSTTSTSTTTGGPAAVDNVVDDGDHDMRAAIRHHLCGSTSGGGGGCGGRADVADVEVTMVETHALLKIRTKKPPKQLSKLVSGVQGLRLTILHLNVTKDDGVALFSFSVKVEDESKLTSVDEIAGAVYQLLGRIQEEATFNC